MGLKKDGSGRRWVEVEVEVPGTPEQVWEAIATGPGISSWFVPTEFREDGTVVSHFGPGMDSVARVTAWEPPHRYTAESEDLGPGAPPVGTEWIVEARDGGKCIVRVVHSLFASSEDWDNQLESFESGWPWFFSLLRLYVEHFAGQPCTAFRLMGVSSQPAGEVWEKVTQALGLSGAELGEERAAPANVPPLAGVVEKLGEGGHSLGLLLRLHAPGPGILSTFVLPMGGQSYPVLDFFLYGSSAAEVAARDEPRWQAWINESFPMPTAGGGQ